MITSSVATQVPLVTVHRSVTLLPAETPVTVLVGEAGVVMVADPLMIDQLPVPTPGVLAAMVNEEALHRV